MGTNNISIVEISQKLNYQLNLLVLKKSHNHIFHDSPTPVALGGASKYFGIIMFYFNTHNLKSNQTQIKFLIVNFNVFFD